MAGVFIADRILADLVLRLQRELFVAGAELATVREQPQAHPGRDQGDRRDGRRPRGRHRRVRGPDPHAEEFIVPAIARLGLPGLRRTAVRRAERQTVAMDRAGMLTDGEVVRYLNRLADLIFVLARYEEGDFRTLRSG